ncbi:MAG TPA: GAF domain-containing protein, partial [Solirubrobacter sp.]|nr:GAF domain-containing protein [Solirubrobacter sp.]
MSSPPADHDARLAALELADEVARALESEPTFGGRLERLAAALAPCRVEAVDGEGERHVAGSHVDGGRELPLTAAGQRFGTLTARGDAAEPVAARAAALLEAARRLEAEQRARLRTEVLQGVTSALAGAAMPEDVGRAMAEHGARALGGTGGVVYAFAPGREALRVIGSWGYPADAVDAFRLVPVAAALPIAEAVRERGTICTDSREQLERRYPRLAPAAAVGSLCAVPLLAGEAVLGAVAVSRRDTRGFYPAERELLEALGRQAGQALERALLYVRQQRATDRLQRLQA